jgi:glycosyltransferase involved in cell wall biosynthesis
MNSYKIIDIGINSPDISIAMVAYNQEKFVGEAIESVLMQKTRYAYKIIIAEDFSTDNSRKIIVEYQKKYPDKIKLILQDKNVGASQNNVDLLSNLEGKYIAALEGDDYWTDPLKLQKQVDFLEANPDYAICFHKVNLLQDGIIKEDTITAKVPETTTINDLAKGNYMHTCSVVYRNNLFAELPEYFKESPVGDYFLHLLNARYGDIKCIDEIMGVYRVHGTSAWSSKTQNERELLWVPFLENIKPNFNKEVQSILNAQIAFYKKPEAKEKKEWNVGNIKNKIIQKVKRLI